MGDTHMSNRLVISQNDFAGIIYRTGLQKFADGDIVFFTREASYKLCMPYLFHIDCSVFISVYTDTSRTTKFLYEISDMHVTRIQDFVNAPYEEYGNDVI